MEENAILGPGVDCYCVARITIKSNAMVSQYSYLCAANHDYSMANLPLIAKPIVIEASAWVCADVFVGARSTTFKDVPAWKVVAGNPLKVIRDRVMRTDHASE